MGATKVLTKKPDIFEYHDYRLFLSDHFAFLKSTVKNFSLRTLAKLAGVSPSYFTMVLSGKTSLSDRILALLGEPLALNQHEIAFLTQLIRLSDGKNLSEQKMAFRKIAKSGFYRFRQSHGISAYEYISNWFYVAIREMADLPDFMPDPNWICKRLEGRITLAQAREALDFLIKYKLIILTAENRYTASQNEFECDGKIFRLALTEFYRQTYDHCISSIFKIPREERHLGSQTFAVSNQGFEEIKKLLTETDVKLREIAAKEGGNPDKERVYHVSIAAVPFSKKKKRGKDAA
jgi:uncharacterized protein (TIGR02147 family)